ALRFLLGRRLLLALAFPLRRRLFLDGGGRMAVAVSIAVAELHVLAVGTMPQRHRQAGRRVVAEQFRPFMLAIAVVDAEAARVAAFRIVGAADEGAVLAEPDAETPGLAAGADARIMAVVVGGEEVRPQLGVEGVDHLGDAEVLGAGDRLAEGAPE